MGADVFGSYVATILATMVLCREIVSADNFGGIAPILLPMLIAGLGLVFSIIGTWFVWIKNERDNVNNTLNTGNCSSKTLPSVALFFIFLWVLPSGLIIHVNESTNMEFF